MNKLLGIVVLVFILNSCGTPGNYYSINSYGHKASVITGDGGYGLSKNQLSIELAVMGAFRSCEATNNLEWCELDYIDDRHIFDKFEKKEWKHAYIRDKHKYVFTFDTNRWVKVKKKKEEKIIAIKKKTKKKEIKKTKKNQSFEELLNDIYGDRVIDDVEGLWGYKKEREKESRIYIIVKSKDYLYKEIVVFHPVERFVDKISTRIVNKINKNSYKVKGTWLNKNKKEWERDGRITLLSDKSRLKFEYKETCYTDDDCFENNTYYKKKIWPQLTYTEEIGLNEEQTEKLKKLFEE